MTAVEMLGPYRLTQPGGVFPLGGDTLALGAFATLRPGWRVCDLGTGSGALLLLLAGRVPSAALCGVELDAPAAQTARDNLAANGLAGQVVTGDLRGRPFPAGAFQLVVSNPPYFPLHAGKTAGPARSEEHCTLAQVCAAAGYLTQNGGRFALCHRPERLPDLFQTLRAAGLEPKRLQLCHHSAEKPASTVLVEAVRGGRPGLEVLPPSFHE